MSITVTCPTGHILHVDDKHAGRSGRCPHCHALVHVPKPGQVLEDEILAIVEPPKASCASTVVSEQPNHQEPVVLDDAAKKSDKTRSDSLPMPGHYPTRIYHHLGVWTHGDTTVVRFGDHRILDELAVKKISDELFGVAAGLKCHHLIVDFTGVYALSTLMLGKLLMLRKLMAAKGGRLILCEIAPEVECVFVETKLTQILEIMDTEADARDACK
jgi:anti-anti-sigma factor